jgi:hypothetical protein
MIVITENLWQEDWLLYHKVIFDGINRLIIINPDEPSISVKNDIYSSWKEWARLRDNAKFLPAIRTTGGDPVGGGQSTGDSYFLINDWRVFVSSATQIDGIIYSDNFPSPFITDPSANVVRSTVSSLVQNLGFSGTINADNQQIAGAVWDYLMADATSPGSVGERLGKLLTVAKYLGLK